MTFYKKILLNSLVLTLIAIPFYSAVEPLLVSAVTDDINVTLAVNSEITIDSPADVALTPALSLSNDTASGSATWTTTTNDNNGYTLSVKASQDPALQSASDSIADYTEGTPGTPDQWSVSSATEFGFSAYGSDVPTGTWGTDQASCGTNGPLVDATRLYRGFDGVTEIPVASSSTVTPVAGSSSTVCFGVEQAGVFAPSGSYTAVVTATSVVN